jgi:hypothetical protein
MLRWKLIIIASLVSSSSICTTPVLGDGLFEESLTAALGDRKANLIIKMTPPVVTTETLTNASQRPVIEFMLLDSNTNASFSHVTYFVTIEKDGKKLLSDWFHDHAGVLRIQVRPSNLSSTVIYGEQDPILNAYAGTSDSPVIATGPIFLQGGLYHFTVRIATVDFDRTMLPDNKQPIFDGYLSVGNIENFRAMVGGNEIPVKILSYYDKISNVTLDDKEMKLAFEMPFDWNLSRIQDVNIYVHEEISTPKSSIFKSNQVLGSINGIDVSNQLVLDNSDPNQDIIHFMISKDILISLAEQVSKNANSSIGKMKFSLMPGPESVSVNTTTMTNMS